MRRGAASERTLQRVITLHSVSVSITCPQADFDEVEGSVADLPVAGSIPGEAATLQIKLGRKGETVPRGSHLLSSMKVQKISSGRWDVYRDGRAIHIRYDSIDRQVLRRLVAAAFVQAYAENGMHCLHGGAVVAREGELLLLLGASKAGKSTLCNALAKLGCNVLSENFSLLDEQYRWHRFIDPVTVPDVKSAGRARLEQVIVLKPSQSPICMRRESSLSLSDFSVSRYFLNVFGGYSPLQRARALRRIDSFLTSIRSMSLTFTFRRHVDGPEACASVLLRTFGK